jgi:CDP-glycerol glycerophosphotransferase
MIDKLIEGKLLTLIVGSVFRLVEIVVRTVHITVRGVRLLVQELVTSRIDAGISRLGKRMVASRTPVDPSSIVFIERDGEYTGDAKYIAEELLRRGADVTVTWVLHEQSIGPFPREFRFVRRGTADAFRAIARAKVVVQDGHDLQRSGAVKAPGQHWVQTGSSALGPVTLGRGGRPDVVLTGSVREDAASTAYGPDAQPTRLGHPRHDILIGTTPETADAVRKKVLDRLALTDSGQRFLLYTPSRAGEAGAAPLSGVDFVAVRAALSERFGGAWEILVRLSDRSKTRSEMMMAGLPAFCRNASTYPDLQELLVVADAGMTDGAGWFWDYLLTDKPAFLFSTHPGARRDIEESPFTLAGSNRELLDDIAQFDPAAHARRVAQFVDGSGAVHDGAAASRVVDRIEALLRAHTGHDERGDP